MREGEEEEANPGRHPASTQGKRRRQHVSFRSKSCFGWRKAFSETRDELDQALGVPLDLRPFRDLCQPRHSSPTRTGFSHPP